VQAFSLSRRHHADETGSTYTLAGQLASGTKAAEEPGHVPVAGPLRQRRAPYTCEHVRRR